MLQRNLILSYERIKVEKKLFTCIELYKKYILLRNYSTKNSVEIEGKKMIKNNLKNYKKAVDNSGNVMYNKPCVLE